VPKPALDKKRLGSKIFIFFVAGDRLAGELRRAGMQSSQRPEPTQVALIMARTFLLFQGKNNAVT